MGRLAAHQAVHLPPGKFRKWGNAKGRPSPALEGRIQRVLDLGKFRKSSKALESYKRGPGWRSEPSTMPRMPSVYHHTAPRVQNSQTGRGPPFTPQTYSASSAHNLREYVAAEKHLWRIRADQAFYAKLQAGPITPVELDRIRSFFAAYVSPLFPSLASLHYLTLCRKPWRNALR